MAYLKPTHRQLMEIAQDCGLNLSEQRVAQYAEVMQPILHDYETVAGLADDVPPLCREIADWYFPVSQDNPYNAWSVKTEIGYDTNGPLSDKTVALKDSICLAGVPMTYGTAAMDGYIPEVDATVVTRLLQAGATIQGKARCEAYCASGGSHTSAGGSVDNPHRSGYSAGGSSSGCGALVGAQLVDIAIGGDQGGSIRIPAAYSGCYGLKPTHGLVPYTGVFPIDATIDHIGPMTGTLLDNAMTLQAIAGEDGLDPRQENVQLDNYVEEMFARDPTVFRIGIVDEGFGWLNSDLLVEKKVFEAIGQLEKMGLTCESVSIPLHRFGEAIWGPIAHEGFAAQMRTKNPMGLGWKGLYVNSLTEHHAKWPDSADKIDATAVLSLLVGEYFRRNYGGQFYGKAQNLARKLCAQYDAALSQFDLLVMPTTPTTAKPHPPADASLSLYCQRAYEMGANLEPTNLTGHPAMSIPCGFIDGLPVGMMLVARKWREADIYTVAAAFEQSCDWTTL